MAITSSVVAAEMRTEIAPKLRPNERIRIVAEILTTVEIKRPGRKLVGATGVIRHLLARINDARLFVFTGLVGSIGG